MTVFFSVLAADLFVTSSGDEVSHELKSLPTMLTVLFFTNSAEGLRKWVVFTVPLLPATLLAKDVAMGLLLA